jgi:hypothetical protein
MSQNKSESGTPSGTGDNAAAKTESAGSAKAAARKKQHQQQKSPKTNPPAKKKPPPKPTFEGIASGVSPMKGIVIAQGNGNMSGQFRVYQKKLAGSAADDKAYGLDSAILDLTSKVRSDFIKPKPSPTAHSNIVPIMEADNVTPTGGNKLVCHDPVLKESMDAEYNMDLKIQMSNWNQYQRHEEAYYRTAIGNVENDVLTYCRRDNRMTAVEKDKDLVQFLLVLRSVCAQNNGAVKVDEEYQNLHTLHSAVAFKQKNTVSNSDFAEEVLDRYGSAIFTCGKFCFGQSIYDKVLTNYSTPMSFKEYLALPDADQSPIDDIIRDRIVARLIIKNSLNDRVREQLLETFSVNNNTCYPNTVSEAVSLLSTFKKKASNNSNNNVANEAVVSYHESEPDHNDHNNVIDQEPVLEDIAEIVDDDNTEVDDEPSLKQVSFEANVMAAVIAEATTEADDDQFFGASFAQLQDVDDAYDDDEPDLVCCAHIVDLANDNGVDVPDFVMDANIKAEEHNEMVRNRTATITRHENFLKDFELMIYHTAHRVMHKSTGTVGIFHYEPGRPELISHTYGPNIPESIIDYSDVLRFKLKQAGIHDTTTIMSILSNRTDVDAMQALKLKFNAVGLKGINTSTVKILREENNRNLEHWEYNSHRYHTMQMEIGVDVMMMVFPIDNTLLHHVVSCTAIKQDRRKPNRWVNKITQKLIDAGINSIDELESKIKDNTLNECLDDNGMPRLHDITVRGFNQMLGTEDFRQGRS